MGYEAGDYDETPLSLLPRWLRPKYMQMFDEEAKRVLHREFVVALDHYLGSSLRRVAEGWLNREGEIVARMSDDVRLLRDEVRGLSRQVTGLQQIVAELVKGPRSSSGAGARGVEVSGLGIERSVASDEVERLEGEGRKEFSGEE